jgi:UDPglucose 6-dehydrogenase
LSRRDALAHVCVYGLWHLGCVTAASLAGAGFRVTGLDPDPARIEGLTRGKAPIAEPGLDELLRECLSAGNLCFTSDPHSALSDADVLWVTFDTPVDEDDRADPGWVRAQLELVREAVRPRTLVVVSSQVPVGFTTALQRQWSARDASLQFAHVPENLRLGAALDAFRSPERMVVGLGSGTDRQRLAELLEPFAPRVEWMSNESAEMTKHALNGFLAMSVAYTNELARICERVGADARAVERGLRSDPRIGPRAYVAPGAAFAGGTLARDIALLSQLAASNGLESPLMDAVRTSNRLHMNWTREHVQALLGDVPSPSVAVLGLTYKPGTSTLRRSSSLELARWLTDRGADVRAYDPAVRGASPELGALHLVTDVSEALAGADLLVLATAWPDFRQLTADQLVANMRRPCVVDPSNDLAHLASDDRISYVCVGRPTREASPPT